MQFRSKTINFRLVEVSDAAFVNSLRINEQFNKHLSYVENDVNKQQQWIEEYKLREKDGLEYYFIIQRNDSNEAIGTVRMYDFMKAENSFCWGSWILNENKTRYAALESAMLMYDFAFLELGYHRCHMDIRKENLKVIDFHKKFGVKIIAESDIDYFGHYYKEDYLNYRPHLVQVLASKAN